MFTYKGGFLEDTAEERESGNEEGWVRLAQVYSLVVPIIQFPLWPLRDVMTTYVH